MTEKTAEPMNTRSFGIAFALSQIGEQPALAGLGTLGVEIKRLIADSRAIVAETGTPAPHSVEDDFQHWLSYSGVGAASEADLRAAYFAGAGIQRPEKNSDKCPKCGFVACDCPTRG